ncbi:MAG: endonuclease/exonuclease/phosphatase family protein [Flavobacteriaceae bacterium]
MPLIVASWNIEKNGKSSDPAKQQKVSEFINLCCVELNVSILFLCEVHSAQIDNYVAFLSSVYGETYDVASLPGGHSNAYVILIQRDLKIKISHDSLKGLNREGVFLQSGDISIILAHFKSGQTGLTKDQLFQAASALQGGLSSGKWAITGDMNWDYANSATLGLTFPTAAYTCWTDQTQAKGGILDWCLASSTTAVLPLIFDLEVMPHELFDMTGPDHKPVIFKIT